MKILLAVALPAIRCPVCGATIALEQFEAHVRKHEEGDLHLLRYSSFSRIVAKFSFNFPGDCDFLKDGIFSYYGDFWLYPDGKKSDGGVVISLDEDGMRLCFVRLGGLSEMLPLPLILVFRSEDIRKPIFLPRSVCLKASEFCIDVVVLMNYREWRSLRRFLKFP